MVFFAYKKHIFMMQFEHNDQQRRYLKAYVQYAANLRWHIARIREAGAYPVIVTSLSRIPGMDEGGYYDLLEECAQSCLRIGREYKVQVIDLHAHSFRLLCEMGMEQCRYCFNDNTHTNDYGALLMTEYIADEMIRLGIVPLENCCESFHEEPWTPDISLLPSEAVSSNHKRERPVLPADLPELPYADCRHIRQENELEEAMWKGMLDPCVRFFHLFEEMPRGQDCTVALVHMMNLDQNEIRSHCLLDFPQD